MKNMGYFDKFLLVLTGLLLVCMTEHAWSAAAPAYVYDGMGHPIGSYFTGGQYYLNTSGSAAVGPTAAAVPLSADYIGGNKAGFLTGLLISQQLMVDSLAVTLPSDQSAIPVKLQDGAGNDITSQANGSQRPLDVGVNVAGVQVDPRDVRPLTNADIVTVDNAFALESSLQTAITDILAMSAKLPAALGAQVIADSMSVNIASDQTVPISAVSLPLPTGASTEAKQDTQITSLGNIETSVAGIDTSANNIESSVAGIDTSANNIESSVSSIDGKLGSLGQKAMAGSAPVVIASDQSAIPASQSGTWNINNVSGTVSLPTGAATEAKQDTGNTSLSSIDGKLPALVSSRIPVDPSGVTSPVSIAAAVQTKAPLSTAGSGSAAAATVSTVITLSKPSNAIGFVLMNMDTSTANIRWALGRTASATLGQQLQPGRDTGFIPASVDISLVAESGTQTYDVQWVSQ
jgi:hypothetical protein